MSKPVASGAVAESGPERQQASPPGDASRPPVSRREALRTLAGGAGTIALLAGVGNAGCRQAPPPAVAPGELPEADPVEVLLSDLGPDTRLVVQYGDVPVEVRRAADGAGVEAIALLCTHLGCKVVWQDDLDRYQCACHEGQFDVSGQPVAGIPTRPLWRVPVNVTATAAVIGGPAPR